MSSISDLPLQACTSKITRFAGGITGLRLIQNDASRIAVWAFPIADAACMALPRAVGPAAYALLSHDMIYLGETGNPETRLAKHLSDPSKGFAREAYFVTGYPEPWPDKLPAVYLQHQLWQIAQTAGHVNIANAQTPQIPVVTADNRGVLERYLEDARQLLFDAGCQALDSNFESQRRIALPEEADAEPDGPDDMDSMRIDVSYAPPLGGELDLNYTGLRARGYPTSEGRFVVMAGAEFRKTVNPSANTIYTSRRQKLNARGALEDIAGQDNRQRLVVALDFWSAAVAAKTVTGAHVNSRSWVQRPHGVTR